MIPQILHWVWPHHAELEPDFQAALCLWREHHPSWRPMIWAPDPGEVPAALRDIDFEVRALPLLVNHRLYSLLGCHCDRACERNPPHQARAVVASVEIVARYGGVCPPIGAPCCGNIESLLRDVRLFMRDGETRDIGPSDETMKLATSTSATPLSAPQAALPLYGATPNHPALWNVVRDLKNSVVNGRSQCEMISAASLVDLVQFRLGRHLDSIAFPAAAFEVNPSCLTL